MDNYDEPLFIDVTRGDKDLHKQVEEEIRELCQEQPFVVLATEGEGQPYNNLISFVISDDLKHAIFATPVQTRIYSLITSNNRVSLLFDNRNEKPENINHFKALTAVGTASILKERSQIEQWSELLIRKHSYLEKFVRASSTGLILVDVARYYFVRKFQEVFELNPDNY
jgi:nitroimidazol reductase NimA-like FMN-containing flavoprotein (pyridoxamine 5'-phosphate oxidase superfamily)